LQQATATLWEKVLPNIETEVGPQRFRLWFGETKLVSFDDQCATIGVPNVFTRDWLEKGFADVVRRALASCLGHAVEVRFKIDATLYRRRQDEIANDVATTPSAPPPDRPDSRGTCPTLSNFVTGPCNELAFRAVSRVIEDVGTFYNPLFVQGPAGAGKSHLLRGMKYALRSRRGVRAEYLTAEGFANHYIDRVRSKNLVEFRKHFRNVDVLIIDDIGFFSGKRGTQQEFLHTFNSLANTSRQIVVAAGVHPRELPEFDTNLVSRFVGGLVVRVDAPDYDTRMAILRHKAVERGLALDRQVADHIVAHVTGSVRALEGALNTLENLVLSGVSLTDFERIQDALQPLVGSAPERLSVAMIERVVCEHFDLRREEICSRRKSRSVSYPRQMSMYLARELTESSFLEIAAYFGGRNHTTAMSACRAMSRRAEADHDTQRHLALLRTKIKQAQRS